MIDGLQRVADLPDSPGVYVMKRAGGGVLYVGKAKSLPDRVRSYFQPGARLSAKIAAMLAQVDDIDYFVTGSELEALILENNLIKKHRPKYNVVLRDDKNYPFIRLALQDSYPRPEIVRRVVRDGAVYFGPYVPTNALRETLRILRYLFPLPNCSITIDGTAERACIEFEIKRCLAPCTGRQSQVDYREMIEQVRLFLEGRDQDLVRALRARMAAAAEGLRFEEAARIRDQIGRIEKVLERQRVTSTRLEDQDVVGLFREGEAADVQVLFIRGGMMTGRKDFYFERAEPDDAVLLTAVLQHLYDRETVVPREIVLPADLPDEALLAAWLSERRGSRVKLTSPSRGPDAKLVALAKENAEAAFADHRRKRQTADAEARELQAVLGLTRAPRRIEAFDISNFQGAQAVGSMVVWEEGRIKKADYRRFGVKTVRGADDFAMLYEVVTRHYGRVQAKDGPWPDLIVIDGGRGQVSAAWDALRALDIDLAERKIDLIGLAKARGDKGERVFRLGRSDATSLDPMAGSTRLLQRIRDEAHRFAVTYHRTLRNRRSEASQLDAVVGIGPIKKRALLKEFGSLDRLARAEEGEVRAVPGMTDALARLVVRALRAADPRRG
ncbi:MAG: excinuclease ABC subunit UvrC [Nitrospirae bacterium]|nr:excinuclease ABC subunit UvrC [Nitrospirota bacterium]